MAFAISACPGKRVEADPNRDIFFGIIIRKITI